MNKLNEKGEPQVVEGVAGLKQAREAFDVAYFGHGKSANDAVALALTVASPVIEKQALNAFKEALLSERAKDAAFRAAGMKVSWKGRPTPEALGQALHIGIQAAIRVAFNSKERR